MNGGINLAEFAQPKHESRHNILRNIKKHKVALTIAAALGLTGLALATNPEIRQSISENLNLDELEIPAVAAEAEPMTLDEIARGVANLATEGGDGYIWPEEFHEFVNSLTEQERELSGLSLDMSGWDIDDWLVANGYPELNGVGINQFYTPPR